MPPTRLAALCSMAAAIVIAACVGDEPSTVSPAGSPDAGVPQTVTDASNGTPAEDVVQPAPPDAGCDPDGEWGTPQPILLGGHRSAIRFDRTELVAVFLEHTTTGERDTTIMTARRATLDSPFSPPVVVAQVGVDAGETIHTDVYEVSPSLSGDAQTLYFDRGGRFFFATRVSVDSPFGPTQLSFGSYNQTAFATDGFISFNGATMYYSRLLPGNVGPYQLYRSTRPNGSQTFMPPSAIGELASGFDDTRAVLTKDDKKLFFSSKRPLATEDQSPKPNRIWESTRPVVSEGWTAPLIVSKFAGLSARPSWVSADGCRLYLDFELAGTLTLHVSHRE